MASTILLLCCVAMKIHLTLSMSQEEAMVYEFMRNELADFLIAIRYQWVNKNFIIAHEPSIEGSWEYPEILKQLEAKTSSHDVQMWYISSMKVSVGTFIKRMLFRYKMFIVCFPWDKNANSFIRKATALPYKDSSILIIAPWATDVPKDVTAYTSRMVADRDAYIILKGDGGLVMEELYVWSIKGALHRHQVGRKPEGQGWELTRENIWDRRADMNGTLMRVATPAWENGVSDIAVDLSTGVWKVIEASINVKTEVLDMGYTKVADPVNKIINHLTESKVDITLFLVSESYGLWMVVPTYPVTKTTYKIFIKRPDFSYSYEAYFSGLGNNLWAAIIATFIIMPICSFLIHNGCHKVGIEKEAMDISESYLLMIGKVCNQGCAVVPTSMPARIMLFFSVLFGFMMYLSYTSALLSNITARKWKLPFENLAEMLDAQQGKDDKYLIQVVHGSTPDDMADYFSPTNDLFKNLFNEMQSRWNESYIGVTANATYRALERVCNEKAVLFISEDLTPFNPREIECNLAALTETYFEERLIYMMQTGFKFINIINRRIRKLEEGGILNYIKLKWRPMDIPDETEDLEPIQLAQVWPIFFLYIVAVGFSIVLLVVELCIRLCKTCCIGVDHEAPRNSKAQEPIVSEILKVHKVPSKDALYLPFYR